jgi:hypothetical protein
VSFSISDVTNKARASTGVIVSSSVLKGQLTKKEEEEKEKG